MLIVTRCHKDSLSSMRLVISRVALLGNLLIAYTTWILSFSMGIMDPPADTKIFKESWDYKPYIQALDAAIGDEIFLYSSWMKEYYAWAGFKGYDLVIRVG